MQAQQFVTRQQLVINVRVGTRQDVVTNRSWWDIGDFTDVTDQALAGFDQPGTGLGDLIIAEIANRMVACVWVDIYEPQRRDLSIAVIHDLRVAHELTNQGIGGKVISYAEGYIKANGMKWAELGAANKNEELKQYYLRRGYLDGNTEEFVLFRKVGSNSGRYDHTYVMYKELR